MKMTSNNESQELLRLFKCVVDTGTEVLSAFADGKFLSQYGGSFERFLGVKKHEIFHLWQPRKVLCCACPPAGCGLKRTGHMDIWIFKKLYDESGSEDKGHIVRNGGRLEQVCIHKYLPQNIEIHELDISAISFLLRNLTTLSQNEKTALETVTTYRRDICHAYSTQMFTMIELNTAWNELENAFVELADRNYKRLIRMQMKASMKISLEETVITELNERVLAAELVLQHVNSPCNNNIMDIVAMENRHKNLSMSNTKDIKEHTTKQAAAAQHLLLETKNSLESSIKHGVKELKECNATSLQVVGTQLDAARSDIEEVKENQEKSHTAQVEILRAIHNLTLSVKYEIPPNVLVPEDPDTDATERPVLWQIATPEHWNLEAVEATLRNQLNKDEVFKKKFVRKGCLIMLTTIKSRILSDSEAFEAAVISFVTKLIEDCDINTQIPCRLDVRLHILDNDEVNVTCKLPNILIDDKVVQTEDTDDEHKIRMTKHWNETEKFDLAFLNSDSQREIEWIQKTSEVLKAKYDLKCAVPSNDYLYGLPLKDKLLRYLNKFQAVILTVTEENHKQYEGYMDNDISLIVVELDYISRISTKFRKLPYINCTICEHQWFPRLINILKTKLPDNLKKQMEKIADEQEEHCEKCKTSCMTAVYHKVEMRDIRDVDTHGFVIFCGSLNDETWILNFIMDFLNQKTECMNPYGICFWKRALKSTIVGENPSKVCICVSPNLQKCPSIGEYVKGLGNDTTITFYLLKIEQSDIPRFLGHLPNLIDATTINKKELFPPAAENVVSYVMNMFDNRKVFLVGEIEANKWIQDNIGNISSLFVDISKSGFQERKNTNITQREYDYDANALIIVTTSVNEEQSETTILAKRFRCWSHCVTIRLTNKSKGSEVGDPNLRFIDGTCRYEEWSLKLKEEVKDQLISGFTLSFNVTKDVMYRRENMSVGFLGSIDDRMWIDEAMLILSSPNLSPCPFELEKVKHVHVYADMMIIFVPINLRHGSYLHRIITENKKSMIPVLKKGTAPLDVFASLETITYERHTWFDYIKELLYQKILYNCVMTQSERSVLLVGSIKDFPFIESAVLRLQLSSYEIDQKKCTKTLKLGTKSATVLFLSRGITKDFELNPYKLKKTTLITILTERMKIPVVLESTTRLEAFSGENQWLERLPNLVKKVYTDDYEIHSHHSITEDIFDKVKSLRKSSVSLEKDIHRESVYTDDSEIHSHHPITEDIVDKMKSLIKSGVSLEKDKYRQSDESVDETESFEKSNTNMIKDSCLDTEDCDFQESSLESLKSPKLDWEKSDLGY